MEATWLTGLCDPGHCDNEGDACPSGVFIPCFQFGRTRYRLGRLDRHEDATVLDDDYSACNSACCQWAALCTFLPFCGSGIFTANETRRVREHYGIEGSNANDIASGLFCPCCSIIRNELEIRRREEALDLDYVRPADFADNHYSSPPPMTYVPHVTENENENENENEKERGPGSEPKRPQSARTQHQAKLVDILPPSAEKTAQNSARRELPSLPVVPQPGRMRPMVRGSGSEAGGPMPTIKERAPLEQIPITKPQPAASWKRVNRTSTSRAGRQSDERLPTISVDTTLAQDQKKQKPKPKPAALQDRKNAKRMRAPLPEPPAPTKSTPSDERKHSVALIEALAQLEQDRVQHEQQLESIQDDLERGRQMVANVIEPIIRHLIPDPTEHDLQKDALVPVQNLEPGAIHDLQQDAEVPPTVAAAVPHDLQKDDIVPLQGLDASSLHDLAQDLQLAPTAPATLPHDLQKDEVVPVQGLDAGAVHDLAKDAQVLPTIAEASPHNLVEDEPVPVPARKPAALHGLEHDVKVPSRTPTRPHDLAQDTKALAGPAPVTPHNLERDAQIAPDSGSGLAPIYDDIRQLAKDSMAKAEAKLDEMRKGQ